MTREQFIINVKSTQGALRRFLTALCCGDTALADDIAQEAYIKAFLGIDRLSDPDKFKAWIYKIAYTTFINNKRVASTMVTYAEAGLLHEQSSADAVFQYQDLYQALDSLSPKERTAIVLFYLDNHSIKEISEIMGATVSAVKQNLSRGRNHLKTLLETTRN